MRRDKHTHTHTHTHPSTDDRALLEGVSTQAWCDGTLALLQEITHTHTHTPTHKTLIETEKILQALHTLHGHCLVGGHTHTHTLTQTLREAHREVSKEEWVKGVDEEYHQEVLVMIQGLVGEIEKRENGEGVRGGDEL
jgi:hypothetical protein